MEETVRYLPTNPAEYQESSKCLKRARRGRYHKARQREKGQAVEVERAEEQAVRPVTRHAATTRRVRSYDKEAMPRDKPFAKLVEVEKSQNRFRRRIPVRG